MAISDKVIELSPVNKKKDIVFYIIMGVLLATTVLFVILYAVKPNVLPSSVKSIQLTNNLYKDGDSLVVSKGHSYTVCATVGYEGDVDTTLEWFLSDNLMRVADSDITEQDKNNAVYNETGDAPETADKNYSYISFIPKTSANDGDVAKIKATSKANGEVVQEISAIIRTVGADGVEVSGITSSYGKSVDIEYEDGQPVINIPYVENATAAQASYNVSVEQLCFTNDFNQKAMITENVLSSVPATDGQQRYTNSIDVTSNDENNKVVRLSIYNYLQGNNFTFTVQGKGKAQLTIAVNRYNANAEEKYITLTVNVLSSDELDIISKYYLMRQTVGETKPDYKDAVSVLEFYVGETYDLQSHIAVSPWSRQKDWAGNNVNVKITNDEDESDNSVVGRTTLGNGNLALQAKKPGKAFVTLSDRSANSTNATTTFVVNIMYKLDSFGYYSSGVLQSEYEITAIKGGSGEIEITYILNNISADKVESGELNAALIVDKPSAGITFAGIKNGLVSMNATQAGSKTGTVVTMTAKLAYTVSSSIGDDPVTITLNSVGDVTKDSKLKITFKPMVEATKIGFIDESDFEKLKAESSLDLIKKYASFKKNSDSAATLTLNMSSDYTSFFVKDLLKYTDDAGNAASGEANTTPNYNSRNTTFKLSDSSVLNSKILPVINENSHNMSSDSITFLLKNKNTVVLTINVLDNPEKLGYSNAAKSFNYSYETMPHQISLPSVKQQYASGLERDPSAYAVALYINNANNYLFKSAKQANGNVYFFADAQDAAGADGVVDISKAWFYAENDAGSGNKVLKLVKDLYLNKFNNATVSTVGITFYPVGNEETHTSAYADTFTVSPIRNVDKLVIKDVTQVDENSYTDFATSGSDYAVALYACYKKADGSYDEVRVSGYDANAENVALSISGEAVRLNEDDNFNFRMPETTSDVDKPVTFTYGVSSSADKKVTLSVTVQNKTLEIDKVELFRDEQLSRPFTEGENVYLTSAKSADGGLLNEIEVFYEITYSSDVSEYMMYDGVGFLLSKNGIFGCYESDNTSKEAVVYRPNGKPTDQRVFSGSVILRGDGGDNGKAVFSVKPQMNGTDVSYPTINVNVYSQTQGVTLNGGGYNFSNTAGGTVTFKIRSKDNKDSVNLQLGTVFNAADYASSQQGGTYFDYLFSSQSAAGGKFLQSFDATSNILTLSTNGQRLDGENLTFTVKEYADSGMTVLLNTFEINLRIVVEVEAYKLQVTVDGSPITALQTVTDGSTAEHSYALGKVFNDGISGVADPNDASVRYIIAINGQDAADNAASAFSVKEQGGQYYLICSNATLNLGGNKYTLRAVAANGTVSAEISLTLITTKQYLKFIDNTTRNVFDVTQTPDCSAAVFNSGTDAMTDNAVVYSIVKTNGDAYVADAPAEISANGILTVKVNSGSFCVKAEFGDLSQTLLINVNNKVTGISTSFPSQGSDGATVLISTIYNGTTASDITLNDFISLTAAGTSAYTDVYTVTQGAGDVFDIKYQDGIYTLVFKGAGVQTFEIKAETYPDSGVYVTREVRVTALSPRLTANFVGGAAEKTINIMDLSADEEYAFSVDVNAADMRGYSYALSDIAVSGGDNTLFTVQNGKIKLNYDAFETINLSTDKTYVFTVSAKVGGLEVIDANRASLELTVTAQKSGLTLFGLYEGNTKIANGDALDFSKNTGVYQVKADAGETVSYTVTSTPAAMAQLVAGGYLNFTSVGSVTLSGTVQKYSKTFDAGRYTFAVKNSVSSLSDKVTSDAAGDNVITGTVDADYDSAGKYKFYYSVDFSSTGETFDPSDITLYYDAAAITLTDSSVDGANNKAVYEFEVNRPSTVSVYLSAVKGGRYYTSDGERVTFVMNGAPQSLSVQNMTVDYNAAGTFSYTFNKADTFKGAYSITYELIFGSDYLSLDSADSSKYAAILTQSGGMARVKAILKVTDGHYKGTVLECYFDVRVTGYTKSSISPKQSVFLKYGDAALNLNNLVNITAGSEGGGYTLGAVVKSGGDLINSAADLKAKESAQGGEVVITVTASFSGGKWGNYTDSCDYTFYVLPQAAMSKQYIGVTAGESSDPFSMADAGSAKVSAEYSIVGTTDLGTLSGNRFVSFLGKGGVVRIKAQPVITSGTFMGQQLNDVYFDLYVRGLSRETEIEISSGSHIELPGSAFVFGGMTQSATAKNDVTITSSSPLLSISGSTVKAINGANSYLGDVVPVEDVEAVIHVIGKDSLDREYAADFTVKIKPSQITAVYTCAIDGEAGNLKTDDNNSINTQNKVTISFVLGGDCSSISAAWLTSSAANAGNAYAEINGKTITYTFEAVSETSTTLNAFAVIDGKTRQLGSWAFVINSPTAGNITLSKTVGAETVTGDTFEYTFKSSGNSLSKICFSGLDTSALSIVSVTGGSIQGGNIVNVSGNTKQITVTLKALSAGTTGFTPVVTTWYTNFWGTTKYEDTTLESQSIKIIENVTADKMTLSADKTRAKLSDTVNLNVSYTGGTLQNVSYSAASSNVKVTQDGRVTATAAGVYTVTAKITVAGKNVEKNINLTFEAQPELTSLAYEGNNAVVNCSGFIGGEYSVSYRVVYGADFGSVDANSGAITKTPQKIDGYFAVEVKYTITAQNSPYYGEVYTKTAEVSVLAPQAPVLTAQAVKGNGNSYTITPVLQGYTVSQYTYEILSGKSAADFAQLNGNLFNGTFTLKDVKYDTDIVIKVSALISGGIYDGETYTTTVTVTNSAKQVPQFSITKDENDIGLLKLPENFEVTAFVSSGNATVFVDNTLRSATVTFTAGGNVTITFVGVYKDSGSIYNGDTFVFELTVENTETYPTADKLSAALSNDSEVVLSHTLPAGQSAVIESITASNGVTGFYTLSPDGTTAEIDFTKFNAQAVTLSVKVQVTTATFGTLSFNLTLNADGITYDENTSVLSVPTYYTSVSGISVTKTLIGSVQDLSAEYDSTSGKVTFSNAALTDSIVREIQLTFANGKTLNLPMLAQVSGKPYILTLDAGALDPAQGYTLQLQDKYLLSLAIKTDVDYITVTRDSVSGKLTFKNDTTQDALISTVYIESAAGNFTLNLESPFTLAGKPYILTLDAGALDPAQGYTLQLQDKYLLSLAIKTNVDYITVTRDSVSGKLTFKNDTTQDALISTVYIESAAGNFTLNLESPFTLAGKPYDLNTDNQDSVILSLNEAAGEQGSAKITAVVNGAEEVEGKPVITAAFNSENAAASSVSGFSFSYTFQNGKYVLNFVNDGLIAAKVSALKISYVEGAASEPRDITCNMEFSGKDYIFSEDAGAIKLEFAADISDISVETDSADVQAKFDAANKTIIFTNDTLRDAKVTSLTLKYTKNAVPQTASITLTTPVLVAGKDFKLEKSVSGDYDYILTLNSKYDDYTVSSVTTDNHAVQVSYTGETSTCTFTNSDAGSQTVNSVEIKLNGKIGQGETTVTGEFTLVVAGTIN